MSQGVGKGKLVAMVAGAAVVGAGVGLLYSPQTGVETRRQVRDYATRYAKMTQAEATKFGQAMKSRVEKAIEYGKASLPNREKVRAIAAA